MTIKGRNVTSGLLFCVVEVAANKDTADVSRDGVIERQERGSGSTQRTDCSSACPSIVPSPDDACKNMADQARSASQPLRRPTHPSQHAAIERRSSLSLPAATAARAWSIRSRMNLRLWMLSSRQAVGSPTLSRWRR